MKNLIKQVLFALGILVLATPAFADPSTGVNANDWHLDLNASATTASTNIVSNPTYVYQTDAQLSYGFTKHWAVYVDGGAANVNRPVGNPLLGANYTTLVYGGGTKYQLGNNFAIGGSIVRGPQLDVLLPVAGKVSTQVQVFATARVF